MITVSSLKIQLQQEEDSDGRIGHDTQYLDIEITDAGGGQYFVLKTDRWAVNSSTEMAKILQKIVDISNLKIEDEF